MSAAPEPWDEIARLAHAVARGQGEFGVLWARLGGEVERWLRSPGFLGRVADDEDLRREIAVRAWEQLQDRDFAKLRAFAEREPGAADAAGGDGRRFRGFAQRVVKNIGIDFLRTLPEYVRQRAPSPAPTPGGSGAPAPSSAQHWRSIVSLTSSVEAVISDAEGQTMARRMLAFLDDSIAPARRRAVELADAGVPGREIAAQLGFGSALEVARVVERVRERLRFRPALELWSQGFDAGEIAARLGVDAAAADRLVNAAKELLRRHFRA